MKTIFEQSGVLDKRKAFYVEDESTTGVAADPLWHYLNEEQLKKAIEQTTRKMEKAARDMDFMEAARLRDEMLAMKKMLGV
jgi:excinuclease ABC subunit B